MKRTIHIIRAIPLSTILLSVFLALLFTSSVSHFVEAQIVCPPGANQEVCSETPTMNPVLGIMRTIVVIVTILTGIAAVINIVIAGLQYTTSGGGEGAATAKRKIINSLIGLVLVMFIGTIISIFISAIDV